MTAAAAPVDRSSPHRRAGRHGLGCAGAVPWAAFVVAALPLIVAAVAIVVRAPTIRWSGDRALTELGVREAARGRQLLGIGGRFGWRHPGPLWMQLLVPGYELSGRAPWSLSVGAIAVHIAMVGVSIAAATRAAGARGAAVTAAGVAVYLRATGLLYWTNLWAGYAFTWPLLALIVVAAVASSERDGRWAVPAALLLGSLLVQTDVSTALPVVAIGAVAFALRAARAGPRRFLGGGTAARGGAAPRPTPVAWAALALLALVVAVWVPPVAQQLTKSPGNMTLLVRFARAGAGGHPLRTAAAAVGAALSVFPFGARWVLRPGFESHLGTGPWWAVAVAAGTIAAGVAVAVVGWRRGRRFGADLAALSTVGVIVAIAAMSRVDGPLNFYLLTWITVLPVPLLVAAVLVLAPPPTSRDLVTVVALVVAVAVGVAVTVLHGTEHDWDHAASDAVAAQSALAVDALGASARGLVVVHVVTSDTWPYAAGVADQLERRGARIEVDAAWVFLFGDSFAPRAARPTGELWFARPHEAPVVLDQTGAVLLGDVAGVDVYARQR